MIPESDTPSMDIKNVDINYKAKVHECSQRITYMLPFKCPQRVSLSEIKRASLSFLSDNINNINKINKNINNLIIIYYIKILVCSFFIRYHLFIYLSVFFFFSTSFIYLARYKSVF